MQSWEGKDAMSYRSKRLRTGKKKKGRKKISSHRKRYDFELKNCVPLEEKRESCAEIGQLR